MFMMYLGTALTIFQAQESVNPQLFTIATLTGHAIRAYGEDYSVCILSSVFI